MRRYSLKEKNAALERLPQPVRDFLASLTLTGIYEGLATKLNLSFKQSLLMGDIANVTIMKLEDEHALETNIHQMMPELSNTQTRELAADLEDRVFREVARRIRENVLDPNPYIKDALEGLSPEEAADKRRRDSVDSMADDNPELLKLVEMRAKMEEERQKEAAKELIGAQKVAGETRVPPTIPSRIDTRNIGLSNPENQIAVAPLPTTASTPSIAQTKLGVPTKTTSVEAVLPQTLSAPTPPPPQKHRTDGIDPYREPFN